MELNSIQKDKLTEIASISFGNASSALSSLLKERVEIAVPTLNLGTVETVSDMIGLADESVTEIMLRINGDLTGLVMLLFDPSEAQSLEQLLNKKSSAPVLPELGNILVGNALNALSKFLKLKILASIPDVATDMRRALIVSSVFQLGEETDSVLVLGTQLTVPKIHLNSQVFFLFDEFATQSIIAAL